MIAWATLYPWHDGGSFCRLPRTDLSKNSAAFDHFELCTDVVREVCKRTSALLVIDDFGAGYSNIERVADLAPAIVKLDLALTRNIHERRARQVVVRHVVAMCAELGARVVAEGVETLDELRCVIDLGVTYAQGYLLARPGAPPPAHIWPLGPKVPPPVPKVAKPTPRASRPPKT